MAIIKSVVIGSGSRRIGEVVLSTVKGRTIARGYQPHVHNPRSSTQTDQRNRMGNCVRLYNALSGAISVGFTNRDKYRSVFNAFVSKNISAMGTTRYDTVDGIIEEASGPVIISAGNLGTPEVKYEEGYMNIHFASIRKKLAVGDLARLFGMDLSGNVVVMRDYSLTQSDLDLGKLHLDFETSTPNLQYKCGAILHKKNRKGSTNAELLDWIDTDSAGNGERVTGANGKFGQDVSSGATPAVSYIGYATQEIAVENRTQFGAATHTGYLQDYQVTVSGANYCLSTSCAGNQGWGL